MSKETVGEKAGHVIDNVTERIGDFFAGSEDPSREDEENFNPYDQERYSPYDDEDYDPSEEVVSDPYEQDGSDLGPAIPDHGDRQWPTSARSPINTLTTDDYRPSQDSTYDGDGHLHNEELAHTMSSSDQRERAASQNVSEIHARLNSSTYGESEL